jgi:hypothetical protein
MGYGRGQRNYLLLLNGAPLPDTAHGTLRADTRRVWSNHFSLFAWNTPFLKQISRVMRRASPGIVVAHRADAAFQFRRRVRAKNNFSFILDTR